MNPTTDSFVHATPHFLKMTLENVEWEELGSSNLSYQINNELLETKTGITRGQSLMRVDLKDLERKLLLIPWIQSVQLRKELPSAIHVQYTTYFARALALKPSSQTPWYVSSSGHWISPVLPKLLDLPILGGENLELELEWLDSLEKQLQPFIGRIHEIKTWSKKTSVILEVVYASQRALVTLFANPSPDPDLLRRVKRVFQYLIKNNILVSSIECRTGKKVVVNRATRP